jgi:uncharacterized DUF497 family protein
MDVLYRYRELTFVWDLEKADDNLRKHGIRFEAACEAFFDPYAEFVDASVDDETRTALIGMMRVQRIVYVVHVERDENLYRIVSAREAEGHERRLYEDSGRENF